MGLFDKKYCDICNEKIGLLGNRKLEDGNLCKNCAKKLSPWFGDRRHSTVDDIRKQLQYREENRARVAGFSPTCTIGDTVKVLIDERNGQLTVARTSDLSDENPDILDFSAVSGCRMDIHENHSEMYRKDPDGKNISYNPPRYKYSYNFYIIISVNNPYFDEMKFCLNNLTVEVEDGPGMAGRRTGSFFGIGTQSMFDPMNNPDYRYYYNMAEDICRTVRELKNHSAAPTYGTASPAAPTANAAPASAPGPWVCPGCGSQNGGKFCEFCGTPRP